MANSIPSLKQWMCGADMFDRVFQPEPLPDGCGFAYIRDKKGPNVFMTQKTGPMILFGTNEQGILGRGDNEGVYDIDYDYGPLEKEVVADMRFGSSHALLRTCSGKLFGWGDNSRGQLGLWKNWKQTRPYCICQSMVLGIDCGDEHSLVLGADKRVYAFGRNDFGQIGDGKAPTDSLIPSKVPIYTTQGSQEQIKVIEDIVQIAAGSHHSLALSVHGQVWSWGCNLFGQLGRPNVKLFDVRPAAVIFDAQRGEWQQPIIVKIVASLDNSMALCSSGQMYMWGSTQGYHQSYRVPTLVHTDFACFDILLTNDLFIGVTENECRCLVWGSMARHNQFVKHSISMSPMLTNFRHPADVVRIYGDRNKLPFMLHHDTRLKSDKPWQLARQDDRHMVMLYQRYRNNRGILSTDMKPYIDKGFNNQARCDVAIWFGNKDGHIFVSLAVLCSYFFQLILRNLPTKPTPLILLTAYSRKVYEEFFHYLDYGYLKKEDQYQCAEVLYRITLELFDLANAYFEDDLKDLCLGRLLMCLDVLPYSPFVTINDLSHFTIMYNLRAFRQELIAAANYRVRFMDQKHARGMVEEMKDSYSKEYVDFVTNVHHLALEFY